jgi:hypothetical protein
MAHNTRIRLAGTWTALSVLTPTEMETFDLRQYQGINGDLGGTWAPATQIILGSAGLRVTGPSKLDDAEVYITVGKQLRVDSGAFVNLLAGSATTINGTVVLQNTMSVYPNGKISFLGTVGTQVRLTMLNRSILETFSGSIVDHNSGTSILGRAGAVWTFQGALASPANLQFTADAWAYWGLDSTAIFASGAVLSMSTGSDIYLQSGSMMTVLGGGQVVFESSGIDALWVKSGTKARFDSQVWLTGTTVQIGKAGVPTTVTTTNGVTITLESTDNNLPSDLIFGDNSRLIFGGIGVTFQANTATTWGNSSTVNCLADWTFNSLGSVERNCGETLSGTGAWSRKRVKKIGDTGTTIDPTDWDYIVTYAGTASHDFRLLVPKEAFVPFVISNQSPTIDGIVLVKDDDSGIQIAHLDAGNWVEAYYDDTVNDWRILRMGAMPEFTP